MTILLKLIGGHSHREDEFFSSSFFLFSFSVMAILLKLIGGNSHREDDEFSDFSHISSAFFSSSSSVIMTILLKLIGGNDHREDDAGADDDGEVETQEESIVDPRHELPRHFLVEVPVPLRGPHVRLDA